jgi:(p)ppGpp synthase/HD superfamily hydrolase
MFSPDRYTAALRFAARQHLTQKVPGSELPYLVHVTSVAAEVVAALATTPLDDPDLAVECALLHDTIEDTGTTFAELAERFGTAVAEGVQALSKDPALPKHEQMRDSLDRIRAQPRAVWIVKLADRITNLRPPPSRWSADKRAAYRDEAIAIADALVGVSAALDARIRDKIDAYRAYL